MWNQDWADYAKIVGADVYKRQALERGILAPEKTDIK